VPAIRSRRDIGEFFDALSQCRHVADNRRAAGSDQTAGAALIPIDAVGLDDIVERPALVVEPAHDGRPFGVTLGSKASRCQSAARARAGSDDLCGMQELTAVH
jgi:hypothetical protein